jgi:predicted metalloendopeptidase
LKARCGVPQSEPQWQLALRFTDGALSDAVGKRYVQMWLPPETKPRVMAMFNNFAASFKEGIDKLDWMGRKPRRKPRPSWPR